LLKSNSRTFQGPHEGYISEGKRIEATKAPTGVGFLGRRWHISGPQKPSTRSNALRSLRHCNVRKNLTQALSRTFRHRFKDFQGPCLFSRTFQALKIRTFKDPQEPWI